MEITEDRYMRIIGKISNDICDFENQYRAKPNVIIISKELEVLFISICKCSTGFIMNDKLVYSIFGLNCYVSYKLKDSEYEIY